MHRSVSVTNGTRKKPDVIVFYDHRKGGVDVMDQMADQMVSPHDSRVIDGQ